MSEQNPETGLRAGMKPRHLVMMSLGSAIGAGLFVGSGAGVAAAGPAVLVSYALAGLIVIAVMRMLGEMVAADPAPGAFAYYAGKALGPTAAFTVGWLWWATLCLVIAAESTAAAQIMAGLVPLFPQWAYAAAFMLLFTWINLWGVRNFGEFEFWFAFLKVAFVVLFLVVGVLFLLGLTPADSPGFGVVTGSSFAPTGISGIAAGLLIVAFSFGGIEIVAVAAAETAEPQKSIGRATRTIIWRILLFYMGSVAIMVLALPWDDPQLLSSPFVAVLDRAGLPALSAVLGLVIVAALLSSLNANVYGSSRMFYSLAREGMAPRRLATLSRSGVPRAGVLASSAFGFAAVALNYFWAESALGALLNITGATLIITWASAIISHIVLRRRAEAAGETLPLRMWGFPVLSWATLAGVLGIIALGMTVPEVRSQLLGTFAVTAALWLTGLLVTRRNARVG
ncbi:amino acid permease [Brevibacterium album]|uniref:amino acid permease n=1 Tax=Brevibacterium album TaxID=417948 RepID=UPI0003FA6E49|nr:amino acid permease [Brevibacterium album]